MYLLLCRAGKLRSYAGKFDNEYEQAVIWLGIPAGPKKLVNLAASMIKTDNTNDH